MIKQILNIYIKRPLLWDLAITGMLCFLFMIVVDTNSITLTDDYDLIQSIISDLISTSISLAGFVLASLTIIVTFKDNISRKSPSLDDSSIELLFSSKHYGRIVGVFTWAVFIFLALFLMLSLSKLIIAKISFSIAIYFCLVPISLTTLTIFRSILVLYSVIKLQLKQ